MSLKSERSTRRAGIEYLRILSMLMITVTHVCTQGGILSQLQPFTPNYYLGWTLMTFCYGAVNCYALISGYLGIESSFRFYRLPSLWLKVVFYTLTATACFAICCPHTVSLMDWVTALTPATSGTYWYFSAYFALFFITPFLNRLFKMLNQQTATLLIAVILILFSLLPTLRHSDPFDVGDGYSFLWLAVLYLIGAYFRQYRLFEKLRLYQYLLLALAAFGVTALSKFAIEFVTYKTLNTVAGGGFLLSYISPTMIVFSVALLGFFVRLPDKYQKGNRLLFTVSVSTFGVYLINCQPFLKHTFMQGQFAKYTSYSSIGMIGAILGTALVIYTVCSLIDIAQTALFKWIKVDSFLKKLCEKPQNFYNQL
ncbi:MAG: acyltransferase [Clostridia bacterium]|nr:acyltransferase [Clostridia bacterium]